LADVTVTKRDRLRPIDFVFEDKLGELSAIKPNKIQWVPDDFGRRFATNFIEWVISFEVRLYGLQIGKPSVFTVAISTAFKKLF
jgi:hypothetical protein